MTIDLSEWIPVLAQATILIAGLAAAVVWIRRWIQDQVADPVADVRHQLSANGGTGSGQATTHDYAVAAFEQGERIMGRLDDLDTVAQENRVIALRAEYKADAVTRRFDDHITGHRDGD